MTLSTTTPNPCLISHLSVREGGVEPPHPFGHTDLNRARLPIPPLARALLRERVNATALGNDGYRRDAHFDGGRSGHQEPIEAVHQVAESLNVGGHRALVGP